MCIISHCNSPCLKVVPTISWTRKSRACRLFYSCLALMTSSVGTQFSIKGGYWVLESTYFLSHNILYTLHPTVILQQYFHVFLYFWFSPVSIVRAISASKISLPSVFAHSVPVGSSPQSQSQALHSLNFSF